MTQEVTRRIHQRSGWAPDEINRLREAVSRANDAGLPLKTVFDTLAEETHRKPNSIRNFYYTSLRKQQDAEVKRRPQPFVSFEEGEVRTLLREVLKARGEGRSVRSCVRELAKGDQQLMLRLQNKYRSSLKNQPELVEDILRELSSAGHAVINPLTKSPSASLFAQPAPYTQDAALLNDLSVLGAAEAAQFYASLRSLCRMAGLRGTGRAKLEEADRLKVRIDYLRMDLTRAEEELSRLRRLSQCVREYLALSSDDRESGIAAFEKEARALI